MTTSSEKKNKTDGAYSLTFTRANGKKENNNSAFVFDKLLLV